MKAQGRKKVAAKAVKKQRSIAKKNGEAPISSVIKKEVPSRAQAVLTHSRKRFSVFFLFFYGLATFLGLCLFASGTIDSEDGLLYLSVARNIYYKHQNVAPPQNDYPVRNINMNSFRLPDGRWMAPGSLGYSLSMLPAVAASDALHHYYQVSPPEYFPLESDWSVLLFASFTNCAVAAVLAVLLIKYGEEVGWTKQTALAFSLITIWATNIFPMAKFSFAQLLFTTFLMLCFYSLRRYALSRWLGWLVVLIVSFVCLMFAYNVSYYLVLPALAMYYFALLPQRDRIREFLMLALLGLIPMIWQYKLLTTGLLGLLHIDKKVFFEGLSGFFLSPGKNVFLFSPPLLVLPIFWHKIKKNIAPELIGFGSLAAVFIFIIGSAWIPNLVGKTPIWGGGMVWGPRYLVPVIPGLMLIVFHVVQQLGTWQKRLVFYPLVCVGLGVQLLGVSAHYLMQYAGLPFSIMIGKDELPVFDYASFIPRYSPLLKMPYVVLGHAKRFRGTIQHGEFDVRFYDGFDVPLDTGIGPLRGFREDGYISLSAKKRDQLQSMAMTLHNVPDATTATELAHITVLSRGASVSAFPLQTDEQKQVTIPVERLQAANDRLFLSLSATYSATPSAPHVIYIKDFKINDTPVNLASLDYPDVSSLGAKTKPMPYQYYGGKVVDPWKFWYLRARISERTFDFWWIKNLYYWDRPKQLIWALFGLNVTALGISSILAIQRYIRETQS